MQWTSSKHVNATGGREYKKLLTYEALSMIISGVVITSAMFPLLIDLIALVRSDLDWPL